MDRTEFIRLMENAFPHNENGERLSYEELQAYKREQSVNESKSQLKPVPLNCSKEDLLAMGYVPQSELLKMFNK